MLKKYVLEELENIDNKIDELSEILQKSELSILGLSNCEMILELLIRLKTALNNENTFKEKSDFIVQKMPLLYVQISNLS